MENIPIAPYRMALAKNPTCLITLAATLNPWCSCTSGICHLLAFHSWNLSFQPLAVCLNFSKLIYRVKSARGGSEICKKINMLPIIFKVKCFPLRKGVKACGAARHDSRVSHGGVMTVLCVKYSAFAYDLVVVLLVRTEISCEIIVLFINVINIYANRTCISYTCVWIIKLLGTSINIIVSKTIILSFFISNRNG